VPTSDFNLAEFYRQMGIQNPDPALRETVQPVVLVGDFSSLTPQHVPPSAGFGATQLSVAAQFGFVQVQSNDPGGVWITGVLSEAGTLANEVGTFPTPTVPNTVLVPSILASLQPIRSVVSFGTNGVKRLTPTRAYRFSRNQDTTPFWIPPGVVLLMETILTNSSFDFRFKLTAVPSTEGGPG